MVRRLVVLGLFAFLGGLLLAPAGGQVITPPGGIVFNQPVTFNGTATLAGTTTVPSGGTLTINGTVNGTNAPITVSSTGLTFTGSNTYTGSNTFGNGTISGVTGGGTQIATTYLALSGSSGTFEIRTDNSGAPTLSTTRGLLRFDANGNTILDSNGEFLFLGYDAITSGVILGHTSLAPTSTVGFPYISSMAGAPTSTPLSYSGSAPFVWDDTNKALAVYSPGSAAWMEFSKAPQVTAITASGTYTTPTGAKALWVRIVGGGGGGASSSTSGVSTAGGGSGAYSEGLITSPAASYSVTIGAGGAAGTAGGASAFGTVITGVGGGGGASGDTPGVGGTAGTGGYLNMPGTPGGYGSGSNAGVGASSVFGGGTFSTGAGVSAAANTGAGGSGVVNINTGGSGGSGVCIVVAYF